MQTAFHVIVIALAIFAVIDLIVSALFIRKIGGVRVAYRQIRENLRYLRG